jgi:hypothetical protein
LLLWHSRQKFLRSIENCDSASNARHSTDAIGEMLHFLSFYINAIDIQSVKAKVQCMAKKISAEIFEFFQICFLAPVVKWISRGPPKL